ncbi:ATP-binding protein [Nocardioides sp.]|uniref:sensor histidine kinase n=1 Tax=Nocardioides sp. TaxID=35761 RepID=UPI003782EE20
MDQVPDTDQLWRLTLEHSPVGMTLVAPDGTLLAVIKALCEMLGYDADQLRQKTFQEITHPDDLEADLVLLRETLAGKRSSYRLVKRYFHADGHIVWGDLSVALLRDADGQPIHFISQILDLTATQEFEGRLAAANRLIDHQRRLAEAVYDTVDVGLVFIDAAGRYETMNRRHRDFMALAFPDGHEGRAGQLGAVYAADGVTLLERDQMPSYRAVQGEEFDDARMWVGDDPITRRALSVSARTMREPDGTFAGAALAYKDVTEFMRALEVKDEFVASVSHELRTPLTSVLGHLELLEEVASELPTPVPEQLRVVERNAVRLLQLVSDLLQVAQVRDTGIQLDRVPTDVGLLVREVVEEVRPAAATNGIEIDAELPEGLFVMIDGERIRQVVDNLVTNGVKYTESGGRVRVVVDTAGDDLVIEVADTGVGIDPEDLDQLFTRFFRGRQAQVRMMPGTGLGLSIVRAIVDAHGGEVTVTSEVGCGTTFRVLLPGVRNVE